MTKIYWRPELLKMISYEPFLKHFDGSHLAKGENIVFVTMDSFFEKNKNMNKEELNMVHKAMKMDLSKVIDWNKSALA